MRPFHKEHRVLGILMYTTCTAFGILLYTSLYMSVDYILVSCVLIIAEYLHYE